VALTLFDVFEDSNDDGGGGDFADHTKLSPTFWTSFDVDAERPLESGHPRQRRGGRVTRVLTLRGTGAALAGHDEATVTSVGGEQAVISHEMGPRSRHQCGETGDEVQRLEQRTGLCRQRTAV